MATAQPKTDPELLNIFKHNSSPLFNQVIQDAEKHRVQIIYTQINRNRKNEPVFSHYHFNVSEDTYFNPASMVKMPLAFLALEKLNQMKVPGVNKETAIQFEKEQPWQTALHQDTTARNGQVTIAHLIKRAFLVSENDPYNRLYQFLGQGYINERLHQLGFSSTRITRQFLGLTAEQNRYTNPYKFVNQQGQSLLEQPSAYNPRKIPFPPPIMIGKAHMRNSQLVAEPMDFAPQNFISLQHMQQMLQTIMFPQSVSQSKRFNLAEDDYRFLYRYLSQYPSETPDPKYDTAAFYDSYVKFFFRDSSGKMPAGVRVFNKVGWSYGFLTDVSYVADFANGVEYMLAATVYVNEDGILNDGKYEYRELGWPFLYELGQTIYRHELGRKRKFKPDLSRFAITYEKRDPADTRPSLKNIDN